MTSSRFLAFWTPSLPLSEPNSRNLPSIRQNLADPLPPPQCRRHLYIAPGGAPCIYFNPTSHLTIWTTLHRVWDYPIREQYTHVLRVIEETGPVGKEEEGFRKVLESENGDFAFIHDAARIR